MAEKSKGKKIDKKVPQKKKKTIVKKGYEVPRPPRKQPKKSD